MANRRQKTEFRRIRRAALAAALAATAMTGAWRMSAQTSPALAGQEPAILAHLNAAIQFYRSVTLPVQKVGEPNDAVYRQEVIAMAAQTTHYAFQSAEAEAALIRKYAAAGAAGGAPSAQTQKIEQTEAATEQRIRDLQKREGELDARIARAGGREAAALEQQREQVQAALELASAMKDALGRITSISAAGGTGLAADIERLQRSLPELQNEGKTAATAPASVDAALTAGVTSQSGVMLQLLETRHALDGLTRQNDALQRQATALRAPMLNILRGLIQQGQQLSAATTAPPPGKKSPVAAKEQTAPDASDLQSITAEFKAISAATVPLSQEVLLLDQSHADLAAWQASVNQEYASVLHALLLRLLVIGVALGIIVGAGELWTRATNRYVRELRRRRQLLVVRRVVVAFLSALVLVFGFVTQFSSLATFAGFLTAGIAVGLQTILLSVAAYFFIIGRFGIKVGDRITIASVTGDVIEVGLVRFYLMELAGSGGTLHPSGRVAVFSNAVLFQAGTPLYKQLPGTGYAWHELTLKLSDAANYPVVGRAVMGAIGKVYEEYRTEIEHQHASMRNWIHASVEPPSVESRLQFSGGGFRLWARFPVEIQRAAQTDEKVTQALLELMATNPEVKAAVTEIPSIEPSVKG